MEVNGHLLPPVMVDALERGVWPTRLVVDESAYDVGVPEFVLLDHQEMVKETLGLLKNAASRPDVARAEGVVAPDDPLVRGGRCLDVSKVVVIAASYHDEFWLLDYSLRSEAPRVLGTVCGVFPTRFREVAASVDELLCKILREGPSRR